MFSGNYSGGGLGNSLGSIFSGIFGGGSPYKDAMKQYEKYLGPYAQAGQGAILPFMQSLMQMQNPTQYMQQILGSYQQSPYAKQLLQQAQGAGQNAASAAGLIGSTPYLNYAQQTAKDISAQDMQQYLQNALGIQGGYLGGLNSLLGLGAGAGGNLAQLMGEGAYGAGRAEQQRWPNIFGGIAGLFGL